MEAGFQDQSRIAIAPPGYGWLWRLMATLGLAACLVGPLSADAEVADSGTLVAAPSGRVSEPSRSTPGSDHTTRLELAATVRSAIASDPEVLEARALKLQKRSQVDVARADYLPRIGVSTRTEYNSVLERSVQVASISASQLLHDFGRTAGQVDHARAGREAAAARLELVMETVADDVARTFLGWWRDRALTQEAARQVAAVERIAELTRQRGELGAAARSDVQQARARVEAAQGVYWRLRADGRAARRALARWVPVAAGALPAEALPDGLDGACQNAATASFQMLPGVVRAAALTDQAAAEMRQLRAARWPRISLDLRTDHFFDADIPDQTEHAVLLNVSADLYRGGSTRAQLTGARHGLAAAQAQREFALRAARQRWHDAASGIEDLGVQTRATERRLASLAEVRGLYETQYVTAGSRTLLDLLNAEQEYFQARFNLLELQHEQRRLQLECLAARGRLRAVFDLDASGSGAIDPEPVADHRSGSAGGRPPTVSHAASVRIGESPALPVRPRLRQLSERWP